MAVTTTTKQKPDAHTRFHNALRKILPEYDDSASDPKGIELRHVAGKAIHGDRDFESDVLGRFSKQGQDARQDAVDALCNRYKIEPEFLIRLIKVLAINKALESAMAKETKVKLLVCAASAQGITPRELDLLRLRELKDTSVDGLTFLVSQHVQTGNACDQLTGEQINLLEQRIGWAGNEASRIVFLMGQGYGTVTIEQISDRVYSLIYGEVVPAAVQHGSVSIKFKMPCAELDVITISRGEVTFEDVTGASPRVLLGPEKIFALTKAFIRELVHGLSENTALEGIFGGLVNHIDQQAREMAIHMGLYKTGPPTPEKPQTPEPTSGDGSTQLPHTPAANKRRFGVFCEDRTSVESYLTQPPDRAALERARAEALDRKEGE